MRVLAPLVRWLLRSGVHYGAVAHGLKRVFLAEARRELERRGGKVTDSALSVLSGVHRKDVRALGTHDEAAASLVPTPASMLFTRWITDERLRLPAGGPDAGAVRLRLPRQGAMPSFEALAREVSSDVHPRTLLEELLRLGLVCEDGPDVVLMHERFMPSDADVAAAHTLGVNVADHLSAAVHNLGGAPERYLEQSVYASGLSPASAQALAGEARELWAAAFDAMVRAATARLAQDDPARAAGQWDPAQARRMRFGVYHYDEIEPIQEAPPAAGAGSPRGEQS